MLIIGDQRTVILFYKAGFCCNSPISALANFISTFLDLSRWSEALLFCFVFFTFFSPSFSSGTRITVGVGVKSFICSWKLINKDHVEWSLMSHIVGPFFIPDDLNSRGHLQFLQTSSIQELLTLSKNTILFWSTNCFFNKMEHLPIFLQLFFSFWTNGLLGKILEEEVSWSGHPMNSLGFRPMGVFEDQKFIEWQKTLFQRAIDSRITQIFLAN